MCTWYQVHRPTRTSKSFCKPSYSKAAAVDSCKRIGVTAKVIPLSSIGVISRAGTGALSEHLHASESTRILATTGRLAFEPVLIIHTGTVSPDPLVGVLGDLTSVGRDTTKPGPRITRASGNVDLLLLLIAMDRSEMTAQLVGNIFMIVPCQLGGIKEEGRFFTGIIAGRL